MKLSELPVSIRASSFLPRIIRGIAAFWSLCGDAATVGIDEVLLTADRDAEEDLLDLLLDLQTFAKWPILPQSLQIASRAGHCCLLCRAPPQK